MKRTRSHLSSKDLATFAEYATLLDSLSKRRRVIKKPPPLPPRDVNINIDVSGNDEWAPPLPPRAKRPRGGDLFQELLAKVARADTYKPPLPPRDDEYRPPLPPRDVKPVKKRPSGGDLFQELLAKVAPVQAVDVNENSPEYRAALAVTMDPNYISMYGPGGGPQPKAPISDLAQVFTRRRRGFSDSDDEDSDDDWGGWKIRRQKGSAAMRARMAYVRSFRKHK